ncbi:MAG TPA: carboxypeptidase-like regulatory domain-containing protein [Planctomicrobium sp.]|nr:carboxypeptidase-like regulatory domain-containing protein [Planctomicrobium sp.]
MIPVFLFAVIGITTILAGCYQNTGALKLVPVQGTILLDGIPIAEASVTFIPERGPIARGVTDENGRFSLTTKRKDDGVIPGHHQVVVSKLKQVSPSDIYAPPIHLIPEHYSSPVGSGLEQTVPSTGLKNVEILLIQTTKP